MLRPNICCKKYDTLLTLSLIISKSDFRIRFQKHPIMKVNYYDRARTHPSNKHKHLLFVLFENVNIPNPTHKARFSEQICVLLTKFMKQYAVN